MDASTGKAAEFRALAKGLTGIGTRGAGYGASQPKGRRDVGADVTIFDTRLTVTRAGEASGEVTGGRLTATSSW